MSDAAPSFIVIGENIHTSRVVKRDGPRIAETDRGPAVRVPMAGGEALLPVPPQVQDTREFRSGRVKHVMVAVMEGVAEGPDAAIAADYVRWIAATPDRRRGRLSRSERRRDLARCRRPPGCDGLAGPDRGPGVHRPAVASIRPTPR